MPCSPPRLKNLLLRIIVDRRVQLDEIEHVTEIERQLRHLLGGNFGADVGIVHLQQRSRVRHFDLFSRPYRQSDRLTGRLADFQRDGLHLEGLETCRLHGQRIGTSRQKREGEIAFFVGLEGARNALFRVGQSDSGIGQARPDGSETEPENEAEEANVWPWATGTVMPIAKAATPRNRTAEKPRHLGIDKEPSPATLSVTVSKRENSSFKVLLPVKLFLEKLF